MKRIVWITLALLFVVCFVQPAFSAGKSEAAGELTKVTYIYRGQSTEEQKTYREEDLAPVLAKDLGIRLEMIDLPSGKYFEKLFLMLASAEPVDWFWAHTGKMESLVNKDFLLPLNDLLEKYGQDVYRVVTRRNFKKFTFGGKIMSIASRNMVMPTPNQYLAYRADLREAVGITKPLSSLEEVETYLEKVEAKFPGQARWITDLNDIMITARAWDPHATMLQQERLMSPIYVKQDEDNDKIHSTFHSELFKNHCKWMEKLNKRGFIHEDTLSNNIGVVQGFSTGISVFRRGAGGNRAYEQLPALVKNFPDAWIEDEILYPDQPKYISGTAGASWCVYALAPEPEAAVRMINWLYAGQENNDLWTWGVDGKHYTPNENGTVKMLSDRPMNMTWQTQVTDYFRFPDFLKPEILERIKTRHIGAEYSKAYNWAYQLTDIETEYSILQQINLENVMPMASGFVSYEEGWPVLERRLRDECDFDKILADFQKQFSKFYAENK